MYHCSWYFALIRNTNVEVYPPENDKHITHKVDILLTCELIKADDKLQKEKSPK